MTVKINQSQKAILDDIANKSDLLLREGIELNGAAIYPDAAPMVVNIPGQPSKTYSNIMPIGTPLQLKSLENFSAASVGVIRNLSPFYINATVSGFSPTLTFSTIQTTILSKIFTEELLTDRLALITYNFSCYSNVANTAFYHTVSINGSDFFPASFWLNSSNIHTSVGFNLVVQLSAGFPKVELKLQRKSGTGNIILDGEDCASLSVTSI